MIYVTGDTHGVKGRFRNNSMGDSDWTEKDCLIICGDFGYVFLNTQEEQRFLDILEKKPYTILFCDGNHENFEVLNSLPVEMWNGGKIHRIRDNIYHLMRGQAYEIEGKKIFVMGGAYSIDRSSRLLGYSYWEEELPNDAEYKEAADTIEKNGRKFDIIISHTAPSFIIKLLNFTPYFYDAQLTGFLEWIYFETEFSHWYFGHFHVDKSVTDKITAVLYDVHKIE